MPDHWQRQDKYQQIRDEIQRTVAVVGLERKNAVTRCFGLPVLGDWMAAEDLSPEIAKQVAERDEHDRPSAIPEGPVDVEDAQIQKQYRHFVAQETGQVRARRNEDPLLVLLSEVSRKVPGVQTHSIAGRNAEEGAVGDAEGQGDQRSDIVPADCAVDAGPRIYSQGDENGGEDGTDDSGCDNLMSPGRDTGWKTSFHSNWQF